MLNENTSKSTLYGNELERLILYNKLFTFVHVKNLYWQQFFVGKNLQSKMAWIRHCKIMRALESAHLANRNIDSFHFLHFCDFHWAAGLLRDLSPREQ